MRDNDAETPVKKQCFPEANFIISSIIALSEFSAPCSGPEQNWIAKQFTSIE